ncbi:hypothetical protein [uncultured Clostridium sp.]|uniref:hypothetical protein n=1 Tax=uncultured Clostridium sp. TaxID=59620 RepID=UPI0026F384E5|nr:hypothetical protein [uncultured Clostridium sp.]
MANLKLDKEKLEGSIGLLKKSYNTDFIESTVDLGRALANAEDNELNAQALENWKKVQRYYNEANVIVEKFFNETKKVYDVAEYLDKGFDAGEVSSVSMDEETGNIDVSLII